MDGGVVLLSGRWHKFPTAGDSNQEYEHSKWPFSFSENQY